MSVDELVTLSREIDACDVRLSLLSPNDVRMLEFRREIEQRRANAAQRLADADGNLAELRGGLAKDHRYRNSG